MSESFGAQFKHWKNQYIELVESKTDRIVSLVKPQPGAEQLAAVRAWLEAYSGIIVEIGSGSGGHLIERAAVDPTRAYIGFEIRFKRAFRTVEKAEQRGINNLFLIRADAKTMKDFFSAGSLDGVYVNFPDPWDKAKWKKNRVLNPESLRRIAELLVPGGFFSYKSDHSAYFDETAEALKEIPSFKIRKITKDLYRSEFLEGNIATEFENLFHSQKLPLSFLEAVRL